MYRGHEKKDLLLTTKKNLIIPILMTYIDSKQTSLDSYLINIDKKTLIKKKKNFNQMRKLDNYTIDYLNTHMFGFNFFLVGFFCKRIEKSKKNLISSKSQTPSWYALTKFFEQYFPKRINSMGK